jgi:hypothetical protein
MEYLTIYRPYKPVEIMGKAKSDKEGGNFGESEVKNWDDALNSYAKKGFKVINSGVIVIRQYITFWAMLEKPEMKQAGF